MPRAVTDEQPHDCDGPVFVTPHAVRQYIARFRWGVSYDQALAELVVLASRARCVATTRDGCEIWRGPRLGSRKQQHRCSRIRMVVGRASGGEKPQLVTVLDHGNDKHARNRV